MGSPVRSVEQTDEEVIMSTDVGEFHYRRAEMSCSKCGCVRTKLVDARLFTEPRTVLAVAARCRDCEYTEFHLCW